LQQHIEADKIGEFLERLSHELCEAPGLREAPVLIIFLVSLEDIAAACPGQWEGRDLIEEPLTLNALCSFHEGKAQ
jgi:hypothetical protein